MATKTFTSLQTDSLLSVTIDFSVLKQNFTTINEFISSFGHFQKKFTQLQKNQKVLNDSLSQFKVTTEGQFLTINEVLESRSQISQGKSSAANEELNEMKKSIRELKTFMIESTRQEHEAQQIKEKQQTQVNTKLNESIKHIQQQHTTAASHLQTLQKNLTDLQQTSAKRSQISQLHFKLQTQQQKLQQTTSLIQQIEKVLLETKVEEFKSIIDQVDQRTSRQISQMKQRFNTKANVEDLLKLEEMMLNVVEFGFQNVSKVTANKVETKKALVFLEKRVNSLIVMMLGEDESEREGLITSKQLKCISCTKDLGEVEGKLDKNRNWSVFPVKQSNLKDKYAGFGAGFQSIVQSTIVKKGGQVKYDQKGRMIQPFNLTGTIQGSLLKPSKSQHKITNSDSKSKLSPNKNSLKYETSFMFQFGKEPSEINITEEYYSRFRGLESFVTSQGKTYQKEGVDRRQ